MRNCLYSYYSVRCSLYLFVILILLITPNAAFATSVSGSDVKYLLGAGDRLRVTVFGEEDLSGEFEIDGSGSISLPLIGDVSAGQRTVRSLERLVADKFSDGYLINPRISIEVMNFRPFFIMGEVKKPGSYPYVNALTVLNAVALAGGYTHRAKEGEVLIHRIGPYGVREIKAGEGSRVLPGDTLRVLERFF